MKTLTFTFTLLVSSAVLGSVWVQAQGRGGAEWTTSRFDGQRTGSIANDPRISVATMLKPGAFGPFTFLWKLKLEYDPAASTALTQPVLLDRIIGFRGFKSVAFVGTGSETVHAIDTDFGTPLWKYHINYTASPPPVRAYAGCPGGLTSSLSRPTNTAPPVPVAGGGGPGGGGRGGRSGGGVGEPGRGAITLATAGQPRGGGAGAPGGPARGGGGGAGQQGAVPGSAAAVAGVVPGDLPGGARAGGGGGGGGRGRGFSPGDDAAYVVGNDGYLHALNVQNGAENMPPAMFLPANTRASGLIVATGSDGPVAYVTTTHGCGSQPDGVWAMDLTSPQKTVTAFQPSGAGIAGSAGPTFGRDGTLYVATTAGAGAMSNSLIALESKTLKTKGSVAVPQAGFTSSPLVFTWQGKDAIAVAGGGKVYLFDSASLASGPVATSTASGAANVEVGALTSWADASGTRWIAMPSARGIIAMKVVDQGGKPAFAAGWTSRDIAAPLPPLVINGVMFVAASGTRTAPGVLYAIEAASGKDLWNSGKTITSIIQGGLSGGQGNVYVPGADSTLYAFGFAIEK